MTDQKFKSTAEESLTNVFGIYGTTLDRDINNESNNFSDMEVHEDKQQVQVYANYFRNGTSIQ